VHGRTLLATLGAAFLFAACSTPPSPTGSSPDVPTPVATAGAPSPAATEPEASTSPVGTTVARAYFFLGSFTGNAGLVPVEREIPTTPAVGAASMAALLAGPSQAELSARPAMYTSIPAGARFLGLQIDSGVATVDLSGEFAADGDTTAVLGRAAQVVYTLTQFPTVHGVRFEIDGVRPKTVWLGVLGRADYTDFLPAIFVDRPAWGGDLGNPARLTGRANVFEATFHVTILDGTGRVLVDQPVTATCGTGCWGTFDVTIPYSVPTAGPGTLRVYDLSARDGSRQHVTDYPVSLTP
jgi:immunoglobulin-like protein involved in spore germination/sporulation and spore germination protein